MFDQCKVVKRKRASSKADNQIGSPDGSTKKPGGIRIKERPKRDTRKKRLVPIVLVPILKYAAIGASALILDLIIDEVEEKINLKIK